MGASSFANQLKNGIERLTGITCHYSSAWRNFMLEKQLAEQAEWCQSLHEKCLVTIGKITLIESIISNIRVTAVIKHEYCIVCHTLFNADFIYSHCLDS